MRTAYLLPFLPALIALAGCVGPGTPPSAAAVGEKIVDGNGLVEKGELKYEAGSEIPFTGTAVVYFADGRKSWEEEYRDGKRDGLSTVWFENGQKQIEAEYRDGKKAGKWISWYENGQKRIESTYRDSREDGLWMSWYGNGQKNREGEFRAGNEEGIWTFWRQNGQKKWEIGYRRGDEMSRKTWGENGVLKETWVRE